MQVSLANGCAVAEMVPPVPSNGVQGIRLGYGGGGGSHLIRLFGGGWSKGGGVP